MEFQTALITGASRGIGRAIALQLAHAGCDVFLLGRDAEALNAVADECRVHGSTAAIYAGDISRAEECDCAVAAAHEVFDSIDVLINNAGTANRVAAHEADEAAWEQMMSLNLMAATRFVRLLVPGMVERQRGAVINISSLNGRNTNAGAGLYAASKHAMNGFVGCLFEDVREAGVKVSTIMPGFVDTGMTAQLGLNTEKMITPKDVADAVAYILNTSAASCPTEIVIRPQFSPY